MQLRIYGLLSQQDKPADDPIAPSQADVVRCPAGISAASIFSGTAAKHSAYGTVCQASGHELKLALRNGRALSIDISTASDQRRPVLLTPGRPVHAIVVMDKAGATHAQKITPWHTISPATPVDR
jgi:hypothetical protein